MRILTITASAAIMSMATAAGAQGEASNQSQAVQARIDVSAERGKKICKTERVTGSLTRRTRICLTEAEWSRMAENSNTGVRRTIVEDADRGMAQCPGRAIQGSASC